MYRNINFRIGGILFLVIIAVFMNWRDMEFVWYQTTGTCDDYDWFTNTCYSGEKLLKQPMVMFFLDPATFFIVGGITFLGSFYTKGDKILMLERASHFAKDAGQIFAAVGAVYFFTGVFNEAQMARGFGIVFLSYLYGHIIGIILLTIANYLKTREEYEASQ